MTTRETLLADTKHIPILLQPEERLLLWDLAQEVPPGGTIVEIGSLYGGSTAILGLANPGAKITAIDWFKYHPSGVASKEVLFRNLQSVGVQNVTLREGDSTTMTHDGSKIDLLWIDGGHDYPIVLHDLQEFGTFADVVAMHDFYNPALPGVRKAYETWLKQCPCMRVIGSVHFIAVIGV